MNHSLRGRHLLSLSSWSLGEMVELLDSAAELKQRQQQRIAHRLLEGYTLAMIFEKPSTRTRVGFEVAMTQLGGHAIYLNQRDSQLGRGETIADTARVLSRMCDGIVARVFNHTTLEELAAASSVPVINGLSDLLHPLQALADMLTIREYFGTLQGIRLAYVGDSNNVSNALLEVAPRLGIHLQLGIPAHCSVPPQLLQAAQQAAQHTGTTLFITHDPEAAVAEAHVVYTDVWASMGQTVAAHQLTAFQPFQINAHLLRGAASDVQVMHCLPMHRNQEISSAVADGPATLIFEQAENRLHTQKALLMATLGGTVVTHHKHKAA